MKRPVRKRSVRKRSVSGSYFWWNKVNVHTAHAISKAVPLRFEDVGSSAGGDQRDRQDGDQLWWATNQGDDYIYHKILVFAILVCF